VRQTASTLACLLLAGCAAPADPERRGAGEDAEAHRSSTAPASALDSALAELEALDSADARDFRARQAGMPSYRACMDDALRLEGDARRRIEEACGRLADAPRRARP
jgi:hypothetical protein